MRIDMRFQQHDYATRPALLRRAIDAQQKWIEEKLGVPVSDTVIFETRLNLAQIGLERILGCVQAHPGTPREIRRLRPLVKTAEIPVGWSPLLSIAKAPPVSNDLLSMLQNMEQPGNSRLEWEDCPVVLKLHTVSAPVVTLNVHYHSGPASDVESRASIVIARRDCTGQIIKLIEDLDCRDSRARLCTQNGSTRTVAHCGWDDLVLDPTAASLLRDDFESFWERESWFREKRIPFRRGYLLHGPPGNGKTTAVRAMMCSRGLSAFTMRLFDERTSDADLDELFDGAQKERPAMVLLEDLDRAFPRTGESPTNVSLQYLLNCLDGVATGEGIVVVATANQPSLLDPAILRRPGRFDRVVNFPNPSATLRDAYFRHMNADFNGDRLSEPISESEGFSFAQLREAYVLAAQAAFEREDDIRADDLLSGIRTLRRSVTLGSSRSNEAGFRVDSSSEVNS
jgi:hypothetical protein